MRVWLVQECGVSFKPKTDSMLTSGVLPDTELTALARAGAIKPASPFLPGQIQPASLDLRIGVQAMRIRASVLPGAGRTVLERLEDPDLGMHRIDLTAGAVLETGCVYMVPLQEGLALPPGIAGVTNPKSSTGRIDVFVRVITDGAQAFDRVPDGYHGPLWAEISPRTFPIKVTTGERLTQLRLKAGAPATLETCDLALDLNPDSIGPIAGYRARRHAPLLDLKAIGAHEARRWFEPIPAEGGKLILDPGEFYILASQANVTIGPEVAAEMVATAEDLGEFRAHYAGFFDPGFGWPEPARAVLEVRGRDVPFVLEHGQNVARLVYEPLAAPPSRLYGSDGSHYQGQGLKLSKLFA
jgi:dCTP deaminase